MSDQTNIPYIINKTFEYFKNEEAANRKLDLLCGTFTQIFRYTGCILLSEYMEEKESDFKVNNAINGLIRPSLGSWVGFIRVYLKYKDNKNIFIKELPEVFQGLKKGQFEVIKGDIRSNDRQVKDAASAILELRNMLAHGSTPPSKEEAQKLVEMYTPCLLFVLESFAPIFDNYKVVKFDSIEEDFFGNVANFITISENINVDFIKIEVEEESVSFKKDELYLIGKKNNLLPLSVFFSDIFSPEYSETERYFIYDGVLNKSVVYTGVENRRHIEKYIDSIRNKFSSKDITMKWKREGFSFDEFKEYLNELSTIAVSLHRKSGKYEPGIYVERKYDYYINNFLSSDKTALFLTAEAGCGKTSLLCHSVTEIIRDNNMVYFINGSSLTDTDCDYPIFSKLKKECLDDKSFKSIYDYMQMLNDYIKENESFVLLIDAVNEAYDTIEVLKEINAIVNMGNDFPWLKVIITIRKASYEIIKDRIVDGLGKRFPLFSDASMYYTILENGKSYKEIEVKSWSINEEMKAYELYKVKYGLGELNSFHKLNYELKRVLENPLNMNIYFKVLSNNNTLKIVSEKELYEAYHIHLSEGELSKTPEKLMMRIVDKMYRTKSNSLDLDEVIEINEQLCKNNIRNNSITALSSYERLRDMGILLERDNNQSLRVSFVYQKHLEYLLYRYLEKVNFSEEEQINSFIDSIEWHELKEAHRAFLYIIKEEADKTNSISMIVNYCNKKGVDIKNIQSILIELIINTFTEGINNVEENINSSILILQENNLLNLGITICEKLFEGGQVLIAELFTMELIKHLDKLDNNEVVRFYYILGLIYQHHCKMEEALKAFNKALELCNGKDEGKYIVQIAKTLRQNGEVRKAEEISDSYIQKYKSQDNLYMAEALTQKGLCCYAQDEAGKALEYYMEADKIATKLGDNYFRLYNRLGITAALEKVNELEKGRDILLDIYNESQKLGYVAFYVDAMNGLAHKCIVLGEYENAIYWAKEGLVLWEYSKFYRGQLVMYAHIITAMALMGEKREAISPYIEKGLALKAIVKEKLLLKEFEEAVELVSKE